MEAITLHHPGTLPSDLVDRLEPVLINADSDTAEALGRALGPAPDQARKLARRLNGHNQTPEQKQRTKGFKTASGLR